MYKLSVRFFVVILGFIILSAHNTAVTASPLTPPTTRHETIRVLSVRINPVIHTKRLPVQVCDPTIVQQFYGCGYTQNPDGTWPIDTDESGTVNNYPYSENPKTLSTESDYLPNVVPIESPPANGFGSSALKAQAVAARTYAYYNIEQSAPTHTYDAENHTGFQYYQANAKYALRQTSYPQSDTAILATAGYYLARSTSPQQAIHSEFSSDHDIRIDGSPGPYYTLVGGDAALKSVYDPITNGEEEPVSGPNGHGRGLSQQGARKWEIGLNTNSGRFPKWDFTKILAHYYTGINMYTPNEVGGYDANWGPFRWNLLVLTPSSEGEIYYKGQPKNLILRVQNTGTNTWESGTTLRYCWQQVSTASTTCSSWYTANITIPSLAPGSDAQLAPFSVTPPVDNTSPTCCSYQIVWDLYRPNGTSYTSQGWLKQEWAIKLRIPVVPPAPKGPLCTGSCAQNTSGGLVEWFPIDHPDVQYVWRRHTNNGDISGTTSATNVTIALDAGMNDVYVKSRDTTESSNVSAENLIFHAKYDPFAPELTIYSTLATWTNLTQLTLTWGATDPLNGGVDGSGVKDYMVEQQLNGGTWTTLVASTQANTYQVTSLTNNTTYTFRITARDWAGNQTQQTRTTTIDRDPPSSSLNAPTGQIATTWTILRWTSSSIGAPIVRFAIDRRINTLWQPLYATVGVGDSLVFEGAANTVYDLRIRAFDAAGNEQSGAANPQISFTTGSDPTGLAKQYFPIVLLNSPDSGSPSPTTAYPLPQP